MKTYTGEEVAELLNLFITHNSFVQEYKEGSSVNLGYRKLVDSKELEQFISKHFSSN